MGPQNVLFIENVIQTEEDGEEKFLSWVFCHFDLILFLFLSQIL